VRSTRLRCSCIAFDVKAHRSCYYVVTGVTAFQKNHSATAVELILGSISPSRQSPRTCRGVAALPLRAGGPSYAVPPPTSPPSICSSSDHRVQASVWAGHFAPVAATARLPQTQSSRGSPDRSPQHSYEAPRYLNRDRDTSYDAVVTRGLRTMGICDRPTTPRSPWQKQSC
jgi:hypothetical protein